MSNKYPTLNPKQVEDILKAAGFVYKRTKGSHRHWEGYVNGERKLVSVDTLKSRKELFGRDTLKSMIDQSGMSKKQFYSYL